MVTVMFKYFESEDYTLHYEVYRGVALVHCEVERWSHNVYKDILGTFCDLKIKLKGQGVDQVRTLTQNPKFAELFGFEYKFCVTTEGKEYEEMICQHM